MVWTTALALTLASNPALPSDVDLRAAYCVGVLNAATDEREVYPAFREGFRKLNRPQYVALDRLRAYLAPKVPYLEPEPLSVAIEQGRRAVARKEAGISECTEAKFLPF